jgi:hypothetical protein
MNEFGKWLPPVVALLVVPGLLVLISVFVRKRFGHGPAAALDFYLLLASINLLLVLEPEPWISLVRLDLVDSFNHIYIPLALLGIVSFVAFQRVEESILRHSSKIFMEESNYPIPHEIANSRPPWSGILVSWIVAIILFASSFIVFLL